jgi:transposase InsO family protein
MNPKERLANKYLLIKDKIQKILFKHSKYGVERIKAELLRKHKINIGRDTLGKLLNWWGLSLARKTRQSKISGITKILCYLAGRTNLLIRTEINRPLQAVSADITELIYNHGKSKMYLSTHKDVFGQMIYGFSLGITMEVSLVMHSLKKAIITIVSLAGETIIKDILFHQDQGSQYTSYQYVNYVLSMIKATLSYSDPGTPTHNAGQESFHGRLKDEYRDDIYEIETEVELRKFVTFIINDYNQERLHTSIGNVYPSSPSLLAW